MRFTQHTQSEKEVKLDMKDKKLLCCLSEDARMPYSRIAKKIMLSKDAVKYRIEKLEKCGVIQGYVSVVDITRLGYDTSHLFLRLNRPNKEALNKLIEALKSCPFVKVVIEFSGKYDLEVGIAAKNIAELDSHISSIIEIASPYLGEHQVLTLSKNYSSRTFPGSFTGNCHVELENQKKIEAEPKIDNTDLKILNLLSKDASLPLHKIGESVGISSDSVNYRIKNLSEQKVILRHVPIINYSALGYTIYAVLMNIHTLDIKKEKTLEYFLKTSDHVLWAVKTIGSYNLLAYICVKKSDELHQTLIKMRELFSSNIKDYEALVAYEEYKYTYFPPVCAGNIIGKGV